MQTQVRAIVKGAIVRSQTCAIRRPPTLTTSFRQQHLSEMKQIKGTGLQRQAIEQRIHYKIQNVACLDGPGGEVNRAYKRWGPTSEFESGITLEEIRKANGNGHGYPCGSRKIMRLNGETNSRFIQYCRSDRDFRETSWLAVHSGRLLT